MIRQTLDCGMAAPMFQPCYSGLIEPCSGQPTETLPWQHERLVTCRLDDSQRSLIATWIKEFFFSILADSHCLALKPPPQRTSLSSALMSDNTDEFFLIVGLNLQRVRVDWIAQRRPINTLFWILNSATTLQVPSSPSLTLHIFILFLLLRSTLVSCWHLRNTVLFFSINGKCKGI